MSQSKFFSRALVVLPALLLGQAAAVHAEEGADELHPQQQIVDLKAMDCRELLRLDGGSRDDVVLFMQGYISGQKQEMMIDLGSLSLSTDKAVDFCIDNPSKTVLEAFTQSR